MVFKSFYCGLPLVSRCEDETLINCAYLYAVY